MNPYHDNATAYFRQYEAVTATEVHHSWLNLLAQQSTGHALDIGAGSGRDARFLASLGFTVTAVEPADLLREQAISFWQQLQQPRPDIHWIADQLPNLPKVVGLRQPYDLVLLSAVWMHLTPDERALALPVLASLTASNALLVLTLRHGNFSDGRSSYPVSEGEVLNLIHQHQLPLSPLLITNLEPDALGRGDVLWQTVVLKKG